MQDVESQSTSKNPGQASQREDEEVEKTKLLPHLRSRIQSTERERASGPTTKSHDAQARDILSYTPDPDHE
ncbi:MAG: hypothetical protein Q9218_003728 [Villophora microphyllina]